MIDDHPLRYALANELHARPFPVIETPTTAVYLALANGGGAGGERAKERAHLIALLDRYGVDYPSPGATHYFGTLGRFHLKWEQHTEFVTYTIFSPGLSERDFDPAAFEVFPADWLAEAPGQRITSALIRIAERPDDVETNASFGDWFVPESLAVSSVLDDSAIVAGDFRIDPAGHMRIAVFVTNGTGNRRVGRVVQRLCEVETYKAMSMLGLAHARDMGGRMTVLEKDLSRLVGEMADVAHDVAAEDTLQGLLEIAAELEHLIGASSFRFGATGAYDALVTQRIQVLREERFMGRQTFGEFMQRRFDPAMRTVKSTETRLQAMAERAIRAGDLLRTRVDVERSAQNQALLESMDRRADMQLRLQKTVEGLSVVAISYYAVNLALYVLQPFAEPMGLSKLVLGALATPLVILGVWLLVRSIRRSMD
ncbi:MAG: DUF3422 domain-containing protein [Pseudomonadota bacterium]